jgi:hypothetical protein
MIAMVFIAIHGILRNKFIGNGWHYWGNYFCSFNRIIRWHAMCMMPVINVLGLAIMSSLTLSMVINKAGGDVAYGFIVINDEKESMEWDKF